MFTTLSEEVYRLDGSLESLFEHPTQGSRLQRMFPEEWRILNTYHQTSTASLRTIELDRKHWGGTDGDGVRGEVRNNNP